ncbi:nuclear GTP-binding protein nug1 [Polyrhizophydium stewartii]|uniref:Nuclear GTP-binding protein nug1 n=1 Tax=Polyrhizophydium stewartii TaxID=2732419 RepID=A0ABR4NH37_9FUNG|nr:Guanine nucleotide-binding protein-like 3 [Polyrhizophydium stewartii]
MVHKKHKSKRQSASTKYKIQKKVNEHHRKARKEAKRNPQRKALKKDPGVPNLFPFKEKLLQQAEELKRKAVDEREEQRKARIAARSGLSRDQVDLAALAASASKRGQAFEASVVGSAGSGGGMDNSDPALTGRRDNSRKAYYREFKKVVENADVILEVLDARDPLGCRTKQIEELILNSGANKRIILVLNKIDLVPRENVEQWLKYLRNEFPTVAFKASTQNQRMNLGQSNISTQQASEALLSSSECLGADNLIRLLKNYCRNLNIKTSITVGIVGFPNVGKSSVINSLKRSKVCNVGATPGVTKVSQTIHLDKNIKLLDCPGIVFSRSTSDEDAAQVLLRNCVKVELLEDPSGPVDLIVSRCKKEQLMQLYSVPFFADTHDFLVQLARARGKLRRGGIPDVDNAARLVIQDWNSGRIPFYTLPPASGVAVESHISSSIVDGWSKEFSLSEIVELESTEVLNGVKGTPVGKSKMIAFAGSTTVPVDMTLDGLPTGYADADAAEHETMETDEEDDEEYEDDEASDDDEDEEEDDADEMDDDDADDQDGEDNMDEDFDMAAFAAMSAKKSAPAPEIRFKPVQKKAALAKKAERVSALSAAESLINPQTNQQLRKAQKQRKRAERRMARSTTDGQDEDME